MIRFLSNNNGLSETSKETKEVIKLMHELEILRRNNATLTKGLTNEKADSKHSEKPNTDLENENRGDYNFEFRKQNF